MAHSAAVVVLMVAVVLLHVLSWNCELASAALSAGFYATTCASAETTVRSTVATAFAADKTIAASLIRLHFHDCLVNVRLKARFCNSSETFGLHSSN